MSAAYPSEGADGRRAIPLDPESRPEAHCRHPCRTGEAAQSKASVSLGPPFGMSPLLFWRTP